VVRHARARLWFAASLLVIEGGIGTAGCSTVMGIEADRYLVTSDGAPDPVLEASTKAGGSDSAVDAGPWSCLNLPGERLDPNLHVDLSVLVINGLDSTTSAGAIDGGSDLDIVTGTWLPGVAVRTCALRDPNCTSPSPVAITNEAGISNFQVTGDFAQFFDLRRSDLVPSTLYPGNLLAGQTTASLPVFLVTPGGLQALGASVSSQATNPISLDPNGGLGHVLVTIYDCQDHQASGVSLTFSNTDPTRTVQFYIQNSVPVATASQTDFDGLGGASNLPAGAQTVHATIGSQEMPIGNATFEVHAGALTNAWIRVRSH
jgi:hypothetical protein